MHHVASVYPVEIHLASLLAAGQPISGVTWDVVDTMNRDHAKENDGNAKEGTLALLANQQCGGGALTWMVSLGIGAPCCSHALKPANAGHN